MKEVSDNNSGKIINFSGYVPPKVTTKQWRVLINKGVGSGSHGVLMPKSLKMPEQGIMKNPSNG